MAASDGPGPLYNLEEWIKQSAVRVGPLWHAARDVDEVLRRYCKHIFRLTGMEQFPYQFPGSGTAVRVDDRHFLFCCGHQLEGLDIDQIGMMTNEADNNIVTGFQMLLPRLTPENADGDVIDVRAFEYDPSAYGYAHFSGEFFAAEGGNVWRADRGAGMFLVFGYPSSIQGLDYEPPHVTARVVSVAAEYDGASASPYLHRLKLRTVPDGGTDGMSGGPVFYLAQGENGFAIELAGMVMRGSPVSEYLHFIEATALLQFGRA